MKKASLKCFKTVFLCGSAVAIIAFTAGCVLKEMIEKPPESGGAISRAPELKLGVPAASPNTSTSLRMIAGFDAPVTSVSFYHDGDCIRLLGQVAVDPSATSAAYTVAGLAEGIHVFSAKAQNGRSNSPCSTALTYQVDATGPTAPTALTHAGRSSGLTVSPTLTWAASTDAHTNVDRYAVALGTASGLGDVRNWTDDDGDRSFFFTGLSLTVGTTYYYTVRVYDQVGNYTDSASSSFVAMPTDLARWFDASDSSTLFQDSACSVAVTANGQSVACWSEKGGTEKLINSSGLNVPTYASTAVNGALPGVDFAVSYLASAAGGYNHTFVGVFQNDSAITSASVGSCFYALPSSSGLWLGSFTGTVLDEVVTYGESTTYRSSYASGVGSVSGASPHLYAFRHNASANGIEVYLDQARIDNTTVAPGSFIVYSNAAFDIGRRYGSPNGFIDGKVAELLVFSRRLTDAEMLAIETYLRSKWGF